MSKPSRSNSFDASTFTSMYKSPAGPPRAPLSPSPRTRSWFPLLQPAGTFTMTSLASGFVPLPLQARHSSCPTPLQAGHACCACIVPIGVWMTCMTTPAPRHVLHCGLDPAFLFTPPPEQEEQHSSRRTWTFLEPPKHATSKGNVTSHRKSDPFVGPLFGRPRCRPPMPPMPPMPPKPPTCPPNAWPKTSPRMSSRFMPPMFGPPPIPSTPASPNWS
mmetsp:Transcript_64855/g.180550  ORF Transcript_64855/g.180550 Transcript_64855/m.180550 type:complete len:217 (-) Transcript_64855:510-1160(-)